jgi:hypothetical protein
MGQSAVKPGEELDLVVAGRNGLGPYDLLPGTITVVPESKLDRQVSI